MEKRQFNMCHTLPRIGYKMPYNSSINKEVSHSCQAQHKSIGTYADF